MSFQIGTNQQNLNTGNGVLLNHGPGTLYYKGTAPVTSSSNDGSLASGASVAGLGNIYVVSDSSGCAVSILAAYSEPSGRQYDRDYAQKGMYANLEYPANTVLALTATRAYVARFVPSRPMTITSINFAVTTAAGADDAFDVGIYDAQLNRIVSKGATSGQLNTAAGPRQATIAATALQANTVYYAALSSGTQGGSAGQLSFTTSAQHVPDLFGTANGVREQGHVTPGHPLPSSITLTGNIANVPLLVLRET